MKRPFLDRWPELAAGRWRVGRNGLYYPAQPMPVLRLRQYRYGRLELVP